MTKLSGIIVLLFLYIFSACQKLENSIDIEFEDSENELVVECYLEAGKPYQLLLTETKDYFDVANICPFVRYALVVITHNGIKDTLTEAPYSGRGCSTIQPFLNDDSTRIFNYGSNKICPLDFDNDFVLEVWDTLEERYITARTRMLPAVPITTFQFKFNVDSIASCILGCKDDLAINNYYRFILHKSSLFEKAIGAISSNVARNPYFDALLFDQAIFNGGDILHASNYQFYPTDTAIGSIYHLDKAYYDYLKTSRGAEDANLNPFTEPNAVISNVQGGHGIFTFLSYQRDTLYIPE